MQHTTNYNLNQWEANDRVTRADFNADNAKIDAALAAAASGGAKIAAGTYTGTGTYGVGNPNSLTFDFEPKLVIIMRPPADYSSYTYEAAVWIRGQPYGNQHFSESSGGSTGRCMSITLNWSGNTLFWYAEGSGANAGMQLNVTNQPYYYAVIG